MNLLTEPGPWALDLPRISTVTDGVATGEAIRSYLLARIMAGGLLHRIGCLLGDTQHTLKCLSDGDFHGMPDAVVRSLANFGIDSPQRHIHV